MRVRRLGWAVLVAGIVSGCAGGSIPDGLPCATNDDCGPLRCVQDAPLSVCPAGASCGGASCVSRCRSVCADSGACPAQMACSRRFAIVEETGDCDVVVGSYVQVCTPPDASSSSE